MKHLIMFLLSQAPIIKEMYITFAIMATIRPLIKASFTSLITSYAKMTAIKFRFKMTCRASSDAFPVNSLTSEVILPVIFKQSQILIARQAIRLSWSFACPAFGMTVSTYHFAKIIMTFFSHTLTAFV